MQRITRDRAKALWRRYGPEWSPTMGLSYTVPDVLSDDPPRPCLIETESEIIEVGTACVTFDIRPWVFQRRSDGVTFFDIYCQEEFVGTGFRAE